MEMPELAPPLIFLALILQTVVSLFWLRAAFVTGLPVYHRQIALRPNTTSDWVADQLRVLHPAALAFRKLSDKYVGLRINMLWGLTGVQGLISTADGGSFRAAIGWPVALVYAFVLWYVWAHPLWGLRGSIFSTLIVAAIPTIDIITMRHTVRRLEERAGAA
jgi:hypothetical protein